MSDDGRQVGDPDLAQAQIVLVTDGEASVDEATVDAARRGVGDLTVGLSVIALGQENPALRALVARQRGRWSCPVAAPSSCPRWKSPATSVVGLFRR